jgi:hypothetical protein
VKMRRHSLTEEQVIVAASLYEQGWSTGRVGRRLDVSGGTVWLALPAHDVQMRDTHGRDRRVRG